MVTANEKYSQLKSTYNIISDYTAYKEPIADPRIYEYTTHPTSFHWCACTGPFCSFIAEREARQIIVMHCRQCLYVFVSNASGMQ